MQRSLCEDHSLLPAKRLENEIGIADAAIGTRHFGVHVDEPHHLATAFWAGPSQSAGAKMTEIRRPEVGVLFEGAIFVRV